MTITTTETAHYLHTARGPILAIETRPSTPTGRAALLCPGGWFGTSTNRNRVLVRLARRLAERGHVVLRLEWHGVGDSTGEIDQFRLDAPFVDDVLAGAGHLAAGGYEGFDLFGVCFGAHSALATTNQLGDRLHSVTLVSLPFRVPAGESGGDGMPGAPRTTNLRRELGISALARAATNPEVLRTLSDRTSRQRYAAFLRRHVNRARGRARGGSGPRRRPATDVRSLRSLLAQLDANATRTLLLYGGKDRYLERLGAWNGGADPILPSGGNVVLRTLAADLSGFATLGSQDVMLESVAGWIVDGVPPEAELGKASTGDLPA